MIFFISLVSRSVEICRQSDQNKIRRYFETKTVFFVSLINRAELLWLWDILAGCLYLSLTLFVCIGVCVYHSVCVSEWVYQSVWVCVCVCIRVCVRVCECACVLRQAKLLRQNTFFVSFLLLTISLNQEIILNCLTWKK